MMVQRSAQLKRLDFRVSNQTYQFPVTGENIEDMTIFYDLKLITQSDSNDILYKVKNTYMSIATALSHVL